MNVFASTTQTNKAVTADESMETDDQSNDVSSFLLGANSSTKQKKVFAHFQEVNSFYETTVVFNRKRRETPF